MRAVVIDRCGQPPTLTHRDAPSPISGALPVNVVAAPITPLDVLCATGTSYFGVPSLPYVPGVQGVGTLDDGRPVWFSTNAGMEPGDGSMASRCVVPVSDVVELPAGTELGLIAALGLSAVAAWMAMTWRGELSAGEQVLVLGAGGVVGQVAVQAARILGARHVIAVSRSAAGRESARRHGADAVVALEDSDNVDSLAARLRDATDGPVDLILDPVFGVPAAAAIRTLGTNGRLVNLGSAAGEHALFDSATLRSRALRILGYTNNELDVAQRTRALTTISEHANAGRLSVDYETVPAAQVADAWSRQATGRANRRIVLAFADN